MLRRTLAFVVLLGAVAPALAARAPYQGRLRTGPLPAHLLKPAEPVEDKDGLVINDDTEILLDGRACKYEDVPNNAEITLIDLSADKKVVRKIHFRSKK